MTDFDATTRSTRPKSTGAVLRYVAIGLVAGALSGLFGVGGGTVIVPMLVLLLAFDQRLASGTSLAAVVPAATVGVVSYALNAQVAWIPAVLLAIGAVVGAQLGSWLLPRIPLTWLRWAFVLFLVAVMVNLFILIPSRAAVVEITWWGGAALVLAGVMAGVLSGLLGVGGGIIIVPVLMMGFGMSDLIAKGTSLAMMIPGAVSGTIGNLRRGNADLFAAAWVGVAACVTVPLGAWIARAVDPRVGNILFAVFIAVIVVQLVVRLLRQRRTA